MEDFTETLLRAHSGKWLVTPGWTQPVKGRGLARQERSGHMRNNIART